MKECEKISSKDISIIVQGGIEKNITAEVLRTIRNVFPNSQVILSTWETSDVSGLDFDEVVFSADVGKSYFSVYRASGGGNNVNRQIASSKAGVELATRKYILKTRTDIVFKNANFLNVYQKYMESGVIWQKGRIAINNFYTRNPRMFPLSYHPSDWITFGYAEDIKNYYNIPLLDHNFVPKVAYTLCPEAYIFTEYLAKRGLDLAKYNSIIKTEELLAKCFVVIDIDKFEIVFTKYDPNRFHDRFSLISYKKWKILYNHYNYNEQIIYFCYKAYSNFVGFLIFCYRKYVKRNF